MSTRPFENTTKSWLGPLRIVPPLSYPGTRNEVELAWFDDETGRWIRVDVQGSPGFLKDLNDLGFQSSADGLRDRRAGVTGPGDPLEKRKSV